MSTINTRCRTTSIWPSGRARLLECGAPTFSTRRASWATTLKTRRVSPKRTWLFIRTLPKMTNKIQINRNNYQLLTRFQYKFQNFKPSNQVQIESSRLSCHESKHLPWYITFSCFGIGSLCFGIWSIKLVVNLIKLWIQCISFLRRNYQHFVTIVNELLSFTWCSHSFKKTKEWLQVRDEVNAYSRQWKEIITQQWLIKIKKCTGCIHRTSLHQFTHQVVQRLFASGVCNQCLDLPYYCADVPFNNSTWLDN